MVVSATLAALVDTSLACWNREADETSGETAVLTQVKILPKPVGFGFVPVLVGVKDFKMNCTVYDAEPNSTITWDVMEDRGDGSIQHDEQVVLSTSPYVISRIVTNKEIKAKIPEQQFSCRVESQDYESQDYDPDKTIEEPVTILVTREYNYTEEDENNDTVLTCDRNISTWTEVVWKKLNDEDKEIAVTELPDASKYTKMPDNSLNISKPNRGQFGGTYTAWGKHPWGYMGVCAVLYRATPLDDPPGEPEDTDGTVVVVAATAAVLVVVAVGGVAAWAWRTKACAHAPKAPPTGPGAPAGEAAGKVENKTEAEAKEAELQGSTENAKGESAL